MAGRFKVAVVLLPLIVFFPALFAPFVFFDDPIHITNNTWLTQGQFWKFWQSTFYGGYLPVIFSVWTALYALSPEPLIFHISNWLVHAANCLLVFALVRTIFPKITPIAAMMGTLVFALHPLQTEPVVWATGLRDVLAASFGLAATLILLRERWLLATALYVTAILTKTTLVALPAGLLALLFAVPHLRSRFRYITLSLWLLLSLLAVGLQSSHQGDFVEQRLEPLGFAERLMVMVDSLWFHVHRLLWPWPANLDHGRTTRVALDHWTTSIIALGALALALVLIRKKISPTVWAALLFALAMISPVLGLFPFGAQVFSSVSDRYTYLPLVGVAVLTAELCDRWKPLTKIIAAVLAIYAFICIHYTLAWRSNESLFAHILKYNPQSYVALNGLAVSKMREKDAAAAEPLLLQAWEQFPKLAVAPANLASIYWNTGRVDDMLKRIEPFVLNLDNVRYNRHESAALSTLYLHLGRAQWFSKNWPQAHIYLCNYAVLEKGQPGAEQEVQDFLNAMSAATKTAARCF